MKKEKSDFQQREIKFRAWDMESKTMLYNVATWVVEVFSDTGRCADSDDCIFMQRTWLYDKKGNEIYEGDIVYSKFAFRNCVVRRFMGAYITDDHDRLDYNDWESYEVVWNIFENPELLQNLTEKQ